MVDALPLSDTVHLTARPEHLPEVRRWVEAHGRHAGFDEDACGRMVLAVDEALANVIRHGYQGPCDEPITVQVAPVQDGHRGAALEFVIRDAGRQVDPATIRSRDLADIRPGGLGVHIIHSVMDEVEYTCPADGGMRLRMRRYRQTIRPMATERDI